MKQRSRSYTWNFQRIGGLDQVVLKTSNDIAHLPALDPKIWVALSCPTSGLEFNETTLSLLDEDHDQRIRISDITSAVRWLRQHLKQLETITKRSDVLFLTDINSDTLEGQKILKTIKSILINIDKKNAKMISENDLDLATKLTADNLFNYDGVLTTLSQWDSDIIDFIKEALNVMGGVKSLNGTNGINHTIAKAFITSLSDWLNWRKNIGSVSTPFKEQTAEVWQLTVELKDKIDDYFIRTQLAGYAPQAEMALNVNEKFIVPTENGLLDDSALAALPLSRIGIDKPLNLRSGINPIWRTQIERFRQLIKPFLSHTDKLSFSEWQHLQTLLAPYAEAVKSKPKRTEVNITVKPTSTIDSLGEKRVTVILKSDVADKLANLTKKNRIIPADVTDVRRLIVYNQHLYRLLLNFASFHDFFDPNRTAVFQSGQLYIDGRCCRLCLPVTDISQHKILANYAELFLLYCHCSRKNPTGEATQDSKDIVAAMTAGDADFLVNGRNGVYIDNQGHEWDATVVNSIVKPISIRQAIWSPYKRLIRFIASQMNKWAVSKDNSLFNSANKNIQTVEKIASNETKFDLGKSMGIFAAVGLAIGAIGTAIATILHSLLQLAWWKLPLVFIGIFLLISGVSVIIAWFKIRQRSLGPLLEASGWAINGKVKINFLLGGQLTSQAKLPKNAIVERVDPMKRHRMGLWLIFWLAILGGTATMSATIWHRNTFKLRNHLTTTFERLVKPASSLSSPASQTPTTPKDQQSK